MAAALSAFWEELVAQIDALDDEELGRRLDDGYRRFAGVERALAHQTTSEFLLMMTSMGNFGDHDRTLALVDLLTIDADVQDHIEAIEDQQACLAKALQLLLDAYDKQPHAASEGHLRRIDALFAAMMGGQSRLYLPALERLLALYEKRGRFDRAENVLYELMDADPGAYVASGYARAFYGRLLARGDHELNAGGLPRDEVEDGIGRLGAH
jgi:tetratricopeptide (TPR) repeat protein